jgi:DNA-directed RNA polymerase specialized sigma54-like protein
MPGKLFSSMMKEIADDLGFHYATISRAIKRVQGDKVKGMIV